MILNNIFNNNVNVNKNYRPFLLVDYLSIFRFCINYNIPIDSNSTHLEYSGNEDKSSLNNIEYHVSNAYPEWRVNLIQYYQSQSDNIIDIKDIKYYKGKYGFLIYHDFNKISLTMFKKILTCLTNEFNFAKIKTFDIDAFYLENDKSSYYISEEYTEKVNQFEEYLNNIDLISLYEIINDNSSDGSFEDLESSLEKSVNEVSKESDESDESKESDKSDESETSINKDIEYILRVDLNNEEPIMKIVKQKSDNYHHEYLDGILYVNICNNEFYIYDVDDE
jgi:hypothetical protein